MPKALHTLGPVVMACVAACAVVFGVIRAIRRALAAHHMPRPTR